MNKGLDWDAVRSAYEARLDDEQARGLNPRERQDDPPPKKPRGSEEGTRGGSRPSYDRTVIERMYGDGMTVDAIAKELGAHRQTIRNNLTAAQVVMRDDRKKDKK